MNYEAAKFWMEVLMFTINAAVWIYVWRVRRSMATNAKISEIETIISDHVADNGVQLAHMDERLRNAIGHSELEPIYERMNSVDKQLGKINGKMETLDLIHEFLMHGGKQ